MQIGEPIRRIVVEPLELPVAEPDPPKSFCLTSGTLPFTLAAIQSRLETLIPYSTDIFVASSAGNLPPVDSRFGIRTGRTGLPRRGEETEIRASEANPETGRPRGSHWSWDRHREDDLRGAGLRCAFQPDGSGDWTQPDRLGRSQHALGSELLGRIPNAAEWDGFSLQTNQTGGVRHGLHKQQRREDRVSGHCDFE